jgi:hypothetical protein
LATIVLVAEGDGLVIDGHEPMVRDGDAVGVAGQILEHVFRGLEWGLGVDDPFGATCLLEKAIERCGAAISGEGAVQFKATLGECISEACHELAPEQPAQHSNRQEEPGPARMPAPVLGQTSSRYNAVHVRMVDLRLAPGVQDSEEPEASAEMLWVVGYLLKGVGTRAEQEVVDDLRVLERQRCQHLRQGENHVRVGHRKHVGLARFEPSRLGATLALRAVAVAARVVGDLGVSTFAARVDVATQPRRSAGQYPVDHRTLLPAPRGPDSFGLASQVPQVPLEDLRDLVPRSLGHLLGKGQISVQCIQGTHRPS